MRERNVNTIPEEKIPSSGRARKECRINNDVTKGRRTRALLYEVNIQA